jgi:hypothetical protein
MGCRTVVSGGLSRAPACMSSKPTTAMSAGTRTPALCSSRMAPIAIWSLAQTIASGRSRCGRARISRTASWPLRAANQPWKDRDCLLQGAAAFPGVRGGRRPGNLEQPGPAVPFDQVADRRPGAGPVVDAEDVGVRLAGGAGDQHDRDPGRHSRQMLGADDPLGDEQPVDLGRDLLHPPVGTGRVVVPQQGDQQRPFDLAERGLHAAQYLFDEQQALLLDIGVRAAAFHCQQADHFLALPDHALRRAVGNVAERLDHFQHARPGGRPDPVLAVDHPGDRSRRDPRRPRDVVERRGRRNAEPGQPVPPRVLSP